MLFAKTIINLLAITLLTVGPTMAGPVTIRFSHMVSQETPKGKASNYFKRLVEQRSNNRILVKIYPDGSLFDDHDALTELRHNVIQMAAPDLSGLFDIAPQLQLFDLPFMFNDLDQLHRVIDGEVGARMLEDVSHNGLVALSFWDNGFKQLTANRRLARPQDISGLKFHTMSPGIFKEQLRKLGAKPQNVKFSKRYTALKEGAVDGQESTLVDFYRQKYYQVQSDLTISNHGYLGFMVLTNNIFWSQLPKDLKVIIQGAIQDATEYTREMAVQINNDALKKIRATGATRIHVLTAAEKELWRSKFKGLSSDHYHKIDTKLRPGARGEQIR